jgi:DNA-directed RNA polymerase
MGSPGDNRLRGIRRYILRTILKELLYDRILREIAPQSPLKILKELSLEECLNVAISVVYLYTRMKKGANKTVFMTEVCAAIGHTIRAKNKLKKDSATAVKVGAFFLYSFEQLEIIQVVLGQGSRGNASYIVQVCDEEGIVDLWESIPSNQIEKLPSEDAYAPWFATRHETGALMVKTGNRDVLALIQPETHPILFDCLNKAQRVGWQINEDIYDIHLWAIRNKAEAFADIWNQRNPEARATKLREAKAIGSMAKRFIGKTFYHLYYYDFRGRKYPTTAYLHEQGSDLARGLLLRADSKALGEDGYRWLLISIASTWGGDGGREDGLKTDKIPLDERVAWVVDNEEIILSYAESPKVHQGWMQADKPWQFLAACNELKRLREHQAIACGGDWNDFSYESHAECYIDGSNNGSQHLSALIRDEVTAPHVNLVPSEYPGDLYRYVADSVWEQIEEQVAVYSKGEIKGIETFIDTLIDYKKEINDAEPRSEQRKALVEQIQDFKAEHEDIMAPAAAVFWNRLKPPKDKRKVVKRNVMTLPYGGTPYGLGQQQIDDAKKHGIDMLMYMEHSWGSWLGRLIFDSCKVSLAKPMQLLTVFEKAGRLAEAEGRFLSWTVPVTEFPVIQNYTQGKVKKIWVQYGPPLGKRASTGYYANTLQLNVSFIEDIEPSKGKQSQGASPNAIHSLDAAHLAMTVSRADFPVSTIHDSYGALLADMPALYSLVRETFIDLYKTDPLQRIMEDIQGDLTGIEYGTLDLELVRESMYCFV